MDPEGPMRGTQKDLKDPEGPRRTQKDPEGPRWIQKDPEGPRGTTQENPEGPRKIQKDPEGPSKQRQTVQAAFAHSSYSSWLNMKIHKGRCNYEMVIPHPVCCSASVPPTDCE